MRKILFAASALSDNRFGSETCLAAALKQRDKNFDARFILPLYDGQPIERFVLAAQVCLENQNCTIFSCEDNDITCYFVYHERFRSGLSDGESDALFCQAVAEAMPALDFFPDILHALDLRTALSVVYLKEKSGQDSRYAGVRRVFNIRSFEQAGAGKHSGNINLLKSVFECADAVVISPECKKVLNKPEYSNLEKYRYKLFEINSEIDRESECLADIAAEKARMKAELQRLLGFPEKPDVPLIAFVSRLTDRKKLDILTLAAEEMLKEDVQFAFLGKGDAYFEKFFQNLSARYPQKAKAVITLDLSLARRICAGADMYLIPGSGICGEARSAASKYGTVPIMHGDSRQMNTEIGFAFSPYSVWNLLRTIKRALATYQNKEAWNALVKKMILQDLLWNKTAVEYGKLYSNFGKN